MDDVEGVRNMMRASLEERGFDVVPASGVTQALKLIATQTLDVVITDLHMPNPSDGFAVVTAMHNSQPDALTLLVNGYPDVKRALEATFLEADEILVKPFEVGKLADLVREKMITRKPSARTRKERVAAILLRCTSCIVADWLGRVRDNIELSRIALTDQERTGYLPKLIEELIVRLGKSTIPGQESESICSTAAVAHGKMRQVQGYTPGMLVHDERILQVTLFGTLQGNLSALDFSLLLPDVMTIADEVDSQLMQAMDSFMNALREPAPAAA